MFTMDANFSLGDLLRLKLHVYADACAEIVDRAQKEAVIEKAIAKIADTWGNLQLTFAPYKVHFGSQSCPDAFHEEGSVLNAIYTASFRLSLSD